jgi:hypothetical protein
MPFTGYPTLGSRPQHHCGYGLFVAARFDGALLGREALTRCRDGNEVNRRFSRREQISCTSTDYLSSNVPPSEKNLAATIVARRSFRHPASKSTRWRGSTRKRRWVRSVRVEECFAICNAAMDLRGTEAYKGRGLRPRRRTAGCGAQIAWKKFRFHLTIKRSIRSRQISRSQLGSRIYETYRHFGFSSR